MYRFARDCVLVAVLAPLGCERQGSPREEAALVAELRTRVEGKRNWLQLFRRERVAALVDERDVSTGVREFYRQRKWQPAFVNARRPNPVAREVMEILGGASADGLAAADYDTESIAALLDSIDSGFAGATPPPADLARLELLVARELFQYARHRHGGRIDPKRLPAAWHLKPRRVELAPLIERAIAAGDLRAALDDLDPATPEFARLRDALRNFDTIVETGGWQPVPGGAPLQLGSQGHAVALLRARLAATGELASDRRLGTRFDADAADAVRRFQQRHGLAPTGAVGSAERAAMNVPVEQRRLTVALNMEKLRWTEPLDGARGVVVNVPAYALNARAPGQPPLAMRVIVGKSFTPTPIFTDRITHVTLNPPWNVPASIAIKEIAAALRTDPDYLERNRMRLLAVDGDQTTEVAPSDIDWPDSGDAFPYRVQQRPGEGNALGRFKFEMPNEFDIYLHDTPTRHLFTEQERDFSHGCVRVERPLELAVFLLDGQSEGSPEALEEGVASSETRSIPLRDPMPVQIVYRTAWADEEGGIHFREDVYALDRVLEDVWGGKSPRPSSASAKTEGTTDRNAPAGVSRDGGERR